MASLGFRLCGLRRFPRFVGLDKDFEPGFGLALTLAMEATAKAGQDRATSYEL